MYSTECKVEGCTTYINAKGFCAKHYFRWYKYGDPLMTKRIVGENRKKNPVYMVYYAMLARCNSPTNPSYSYYGGRGIKVAERWQGLDGFAHFIEDMGERPEGMTLERINNELGYSPENCQWATRRTQQLNRRAQSNNSSGVIGVSKYKATGKWTAQVYIQGKKKHLGYFDTIEEATKARNDARKTKPFRKEASNG